VGESGERDRLFGERDRLFICRGREWKKDRLIIGRPQTDVSTEKGQAKYLLEKALAKLFT
jgi:hypothetical protein